MGVSPLAGVRGSAPRTLPRAQLARGIKNSGLSHYKAGIPSKDSRA
jgi:hypothetical protein